MLKRCLYLLVALLTPSLLLAQKAKINAGLAAYDAKNYESAIDNLTEGLKNTAEVKKPLIAKGWLRMGQSYLQYVLGKQVLGQLKKEGTPTLADKYPTPLLDAQKAFDQASANDDDKKLEAEIKSARSDLPNLLYNKGYELYQNKDYAKALEYENAAEVEFTGKADPYQFYNLRAYTKLATGDTLGAIPDFAHVIKAFDADTTKEKKADNTTLTNTYRYLALLVMNQQKDLDKAAQILQEARKRFPEDDNLRDMELQLYSNDKFKSEALPKYKQEAERSPGDARIQLIYGTMLEATDPATALLQYQKAIKINPDTYEAYLYISDYYIKQGTTAQKKYNETPNSNTKDLDKYKAEFNTQFKNALPYLEKAYELKKDNPEVVNALFQLYSLLDMNDKATEMMKIKKELQGK